MKQITDIFIERPVLAIVVSFFILVMGLRSINLLPIRQYPFTQNAVVSVNTVYTGANPDVMAGFVTTPLEKSIAQANGIDYMTSSSTQSVSQIQANLVLNYDPLKALSDITTKVNAVLNQLPTGTQQPAITVEVGETIASMYIGFYSDVLPNNKITDYLTRVVQPKLQTIPGVQVAQILGGRDYAMRIWLNPLKLAGYGVTPTDVANVLTANNFISAVGRTDGNTFILNLTAATDITTVDEFKRLIVKTSGGSFVRLGDVADVTLGAKNYDSLVSFDGKSAVYIGIKVTPAANLLTVINDIRTVFPQIQAELPNGLNANIVYDASAYVNSSIWEVLTTLIEAFLIVTIVIYLFLGSIRSVIIPLLAIPLSLIGAFFLMYLLGYSINLLTLLALVLAIGLVVDDAIIIVENIQRHMEEGKSAYKAAILGARELGMPIIAISIVLVAVYIPIGFMGGLTGALFTEFAFTLAGAVAISAIIALTLSPMMCANVLKLSSDTKYDFSRFVDKQFTRLELVYKRFLNYILNILPVVILFAIIILLSNIYLFMTSKSELAPQEDQGIIVTLLTAAPNTALHQTKIYADQIGKVFWSFPETDHSFQVIGVNGVNTGFSGMVLKPWDKRKLTTNILQPQVQQKVNQIAGAQIAAFQLPSLPGGGSGLPIQFVIKTTESYEHLNQVTQNFLDAAKKSGIFMFLDTDLKIDKQQSSVVLNREKIAEFGLTMRDVGSALGYGLSQGYVNYFDYAGRSYQVIPQMIREARINPDQLLEYYIKNKDGELLALKTVAKIKNIVVPESLNHFQQLNSATISGIAFPGVAMGDALQSLTALAKLQLPNGYFIDYASQSRQFMQEGSSLFITFFFALLIIFLSLAALFESFKDPLIVLISVPMSICGAMIFISLGFHGASLNIYSQVGLITLIGLISKHGILIVQFANDLQAQGRCKREAIEEASKIRLRPILMTTAAMVLGVIPLITASGAGAVSRYNIGLVIATGIAIGTLFTLFVVPAMYLFLATDYSKKLNMNDNEVKL